MDFCRLDNRDEKTIGRALWYKGQHYYIDRDDEFARKKDLPKIGTCCSPAGNVFDIFRGFAESRLGDVKEFACAVYRYNIA